MPRCEPRPAVQYSTATAPRPLALVDFVVVCVAVTAVLLVAYRYAVRYTFVGRLLNGRRTRAADQAGRAALADT